MLQALPEPGVAEAGWAGSLVAGESRWRRAEEAKGVLATLAALAATLHTGCHLRRGDRLLEGERLLEGSVWCPRGAGVVPEREGAASTRELGGGSQPLGIEAAEGTLGIA